MTAVKNFRVDSFVAGLAIKAPVKVASSGPLTLAGEQTVNSRLLLAGDRVLVKDQVDPIENGIYVVETSAWQRAGDFDGNRDVVGGTVVPAYRVADGAFVYWITGGNGVALEPSVDAMNFSVFYDPLGGAVEVDTLQDVTTRGNTTDQGIIMTVANLETQGGIEIDIRDAGILRWRDSADVESVTTQIESTTMAPAPALVFDSTAAIEVFSFDKAINIDGNDGIYLSGDTAAVHFFRYGDAVSSQIRGGSGNANIEYVAVAGDHEFTGDLTLNASYVLQFPTHRVPVLQFSIITNSVTVNVNQTAFARIDVEEATANFNVVLTAPAAGTGFYHEIVLEFSQGSGGYDAIWPASVTWPGGTAPVLSAANNAIDTVHLYTRDGGTTWRGTFQQDYS